MGIDIAESALEAARERASRLGADALFRQGAFEATGLETGSADAVMSVDAFLFTPTRRLGWSSSGASSAPAGAW